MASNKFAGSKANIKPPAQCFTTTPPPVPWLPPAGPPHVRAYARWTDLDPLAPVDAAMYISLPRDGANFHYSGSNTHHGIYLALDFKRLADPNPWELAFTIIGPFRPDPGETYTWTPITIQVDPSLDTGLLTHYVLHAKDFRLVRIMQ